MRLAIVSPSFYPATVYGGPIFSVLYVATELAKIKNIEVFAITTNANMSDRLDVETNKWKYFSDNFHVKYYNETKVNVISLGLLFNAWKDIKTMDVVHIQYMFNTSTLIALFYAYVFRKKVVLSPRGALCHWCINQGSKFKTIWLRFLVQPFIKNVMWHATAEQEKNEILNQFPSAKVEIIPNGIFLKDYEEIDFLNKVEYLGKYVGISPNKINKIIVSMGRIHKIKGFDILINAFARVILTEQNSYLLIAGSDEGEKENLQKLITELNLEKNVFFIGEVRGSNKINFLANADLFVLASHNENFGNVYAESLASGTPIVASTSTPWQEVETENCGKWVDNNQQDVADAIIVMFSKDRVQMRINSKKFIRKFEWKNIALQFKKKYESLLNETSKS